MNLIWPASRLLGPPLASTTSCAAVDRVIPVEIRRACRAELCHLGLSEASLGSIIAANCFFLPILPSERRGHPPSSAWRSSPPPPPAGAAHRRRSPDPQRRHAWPPAPARPRRYGAQGSQTHAPPGRRASSSAK